MRLEPLDNGSRALAGDGILRRYREQPRCGVRDGEIHTCLSALGGLIEALVSEDEAERLAGLEEQ